MLRRLFNVSAIRTNRAILPLQKPKYEEPKRTSVCYSLVRGQKCWPFAQAEFEAAEASVLEAEVQLAKTKLTAPFEGTIVTLDAEVGEYLQPGIGVAQIGELNRWLIETDDLIELDVINVAEGAPVRIIIDSMPGLDLTGTVVRVRRIGENKVGDITYTVYIEPDRYVPELAWNMTASVHIERTPNQGLSPAN